LQNGRAELADFVAIMLNERVMVQAPHVLVAGAITGGLFVLGISAWHLLRNSHVDVFSRSARIALVFTTVASLAAATTGHSQAQNTAESQPMKMAAMEGLWESEQPASFSLFAIHDQANQTSQREIKVPYMLSVLAHNDTTSRVEGIRDLQAAAVAEHGPGDYVPPVTIVYWSFRIMVGLGMAFILFGLWGLALWFLGRLDTHRLYHRIAIVMLFLPFVANTAGWIVTEMGRQPWVVYGLLKTADGVSPNITGATVWMSLIGFTTIYGILSVINFYLIHKFARPKDPTETAEDGTLGSSPLAGLDPAHTY
jgi:cytochrome bd ubiquinol oxidase subunit I